MPARREVLAALGSVSTLGLAGCSLFSGRGPDPGVTTVDGDGDLTVTSSAFDDGEPIPVKYTRDGADVSPPLSIDGVPGAAQSLVLIVDDPDAPSGSFTHWLLWDVSPETTEIPEAIPQARQLDILGRAKQGTNGFGELGYRGPAPPAEDGPHRYRFTLFAVEPDLPVQAGASRATVDREMEGIVGESARVTGTYDRG